LGISFFVFLCFIIITARVFGKPKLTSFLVSLEIILRKFNKDSLNLYESHVKKTKEIQALSDVMKFLEQRLSSISSFPQENKPLRKEFQKKSNKENCSCCNLPNHNVTQCYKFKGMEPAEKKSLGKKRHICLKSLRHSSNKKCTNEVIFLNCKKNPTTRVFTLIII